MSGSDRIPAPGGVTPGWLSDRLRAAGHAGAEISGFRYEPVGTAYVSGCFRFTLRYARPAPEYPATLIGKFPSSDAAISEMSSGVYANEVAFYRNLRSRVTIPTPGCYHADFDQGDSAFVLLLEDMQPAQQGDQMAGCDPGLARAAVLALVGLHAPTWCDASLRETGWLARDDPAGFQTLLKDLYRAFLSESLDTFAADLPAEAKTLLDRVGEAAVFPLGVPDPAPFALTHGDYRLDNLLIDDRRTPPLITAVDWQATGVASPLTDVAYFMGASLRPADRRESEESIVRAYHDALCAAGVEHFGRAACWEEYRRASLYGLGLTILARGVAARNEPGDDLFRMMLQRHTAHALDLGAEEFLD